MKEGTWHRLPGRELFGSIWELLAAGATAGVIARLGRGLGTSVVVAHGEVLRRAAAEYAVRWHPCAIIQVAR